MKKIPLNLSEEILLVNEISNLIEQSKLKVVSQINSSLTILFWQIGNHINTAILNNKRADYGKQIVATVSRQIELKYGRNFSEKNVRRMIQFSEKFKDFQIVVTLSRQLTSHYQISLSIDN